MPTESAYPKIAIPAVDVWGCLFERKDRKFPDSKGRCSNKPLAFDESNCLPPVIYIDANTSRSYTLAQVQSAAADFGKGLKSNWEWKKGDVVALYTPNHIDIPPIIWGTHWAGGVITATNPGK